MRCPYRYEGENRKRKKEYKISDELSITTKNARQCISIANFNQQYSQRCNIKIFGWREKSKEDPKQKFCAVLKQKVKVDVNPQDILAIHRVPGDRNNSVLCRIIVKMISRKQMKEEFLMVDDITQQNAILIQKLIEHKRVHSARYFNSKVFPIEKNYRRYTFCIFGDINKKTSSMMSTVAVPLKYTLLL